MFRWAVSQEMIPSEIYQALTTLAPLKRGRSEARESEPVRPVPEEFVHAIRPHVSRQVWAMIQLQLLTGMRPGEVVQLRWCDLKISDYVWIYEPPVHKMAYLAQSRKVLLGPQAQAIVRQFLTVNPQAPLFSPAIAETERRQALHRNRRTPLGYGNRPGTNRKSHRQSPPRDRYDVDSYRHAITRGCDKADRFSKGGRTTADDDRSIPRWHPNQLRHNFATRMRELGGIDVTQTLLGHSVGSKVTEIYAESNVRKASTLIAEVG
jgi:integrase